MTQWGNAARLEMQRPTARNSVLLKQYKLYLDENIAKDLPPLPNGLTIVEAISDYLRAFHEHVVTELRKGFAKNYGQHQFRYVSVVVWCAVDHGRVTRLSFSLVPVFNCSRHVV